MLKFSANLGFLWPDLSLLDRIDAAARVGFRAIELHWPYETPAAAVRARCAANGITLLGINTARGDVAAGEFGLGALAGREAEFQASVDQSIRYCVDAGGSSIHCMAGKVDPGARPDACHIFRDNLREASAKAGPQGISLLLEPINPNDAPNYFYSTVSEGAAIIEQAGCANIRLMFDCYHVGRSEGDVLTRLTQFMPIIGHVQIAAVPSRAEPDEGEINYNVIFKALETLGYAGWIGAEYKPRGATVAGLGWVGRLNVRL